MSSAPYYVFFLESSDKTIYVGTSSRLETRIGEHQDGIHKKAYTYSRRPVKLLGAFPCQSTLEALKKERTAKKWSRNKKLAFLNGDAETFRWLSKNPCEKKRLLKRTAEAAE